MSVPTIRLGGRAELINHVRRPRARTRRRLQLPARHAGLVEDRRRLAGAGRAVLAGPRANESCVERGMTDSDPQAGCLIAPHQRHLASGAGKGPPGRVPTG